VGAAAAFMIRLRTALVLGRVSNLPTLFSNVLAGVALSGAPTNGVGSAMAALAMFYVGGMYLNDAFDADADACERPTRPIPRGDASRGAVFGMGFLLLALGVCIVAAHGPIAGLVGATLAACIVLYDAVHKRASLAAVIMGLCRLLCYVTAASIAGGSLDAPLLLLGAVGLFCHVVGVTYAARKEAYGRLDAAWPLAALGFPLCIALGVARGDILALAPWVALTAAVVLGLRWLFRRALNDMPRAIGLLIAAISLYDATLIAATGATWSAIAAAVCFPATLVFQRAIPGT
jgi:4-hydroxybenzoate polyprenyltransferase